MTPQDNDMEENGTAPGGLAGADAATLRAARKPLKKTVTITLEIDLRALTRAELTECDVSPSEGSCADWLDETRATDIAAMAEMALQQEEVQSEMFAGSMHFASITAVRAIGGWDGPHVGGSRAVHTPSDQQQRYDLKPSDNNQ